MTKRYASTLATWQPRALALLRIVAGYMFLLHGTGKLLHLPLIDGYEVVQAISFDGLAGMIELDCGLLVLIGWFTRPAAFVACGQMAVAYFIAHASSATLLVPMQNGGELAVLYCFVFLFLAVSGAGAWSIDTLRPRRGRPAGEAK